MSKYFITVLIFVFSFVSTQAQQTQTGSEITFEKLVHNYGEIIQSGNGEYSFVFKNTGNEPLILSNVRSSCGCTVPEWPRNPIMPGQSSNIKVIYDTNIIGPINRQVTIMSNATNSPTVLRISGNVIARPAEILPIQQNHFSPSSKPQR